MVKRKNPKAKTVETTTFRHETPQGRFISWLAGMVAEKLAAQDIHQLVFPRDNKKTTSHNIITSTTRQAD